MKQNRLAEQVVFPLNQIPFRIRTADEVHDERFKVKMKFFFSEFRFTVLRDFLIGSVKRKNLCKVEIFKSIEESETFH